MIKLGTVGTSRITEGFLSGAALTGEFEHIAVYSRSLDTGKAFAERFRAKEVYTDLVEMAKSGIDAVYIASPNVFHVKQSRVFLENGIHVICEKPIATNALEFMDLKKFADSRGLVYMEAIIPRHISGYGAVKQALHKIGKKSMARIDFCQRSSRLDDFLQGKHVNIFDMSLHAGTLMDLGVYCVYGAVDLLGIPDKIEAEATLLDNGADGSGAAIFTYPDFTAVLSYSKTGDTACGSEIIGQNGTLKIKKISQYTDVTLVKDGIETKITGSLTKAELMSDEAKRFADYINAPELFADDYRTASLLCENVHKLMDKIKLSAGLKYI